jgi:hypothetical protein
MKNKNGICEKLHKSSTNSTENKYVYGKLANLINNFTTREYIHPPQKILNLKKKKEQ